MYFLKQMKRLALASSSHRKLEGLSKKSFLFGALHTQVSEKAQSISFFFFVFVFVFLPFLGPFPRRMEVPRLGVESEL